jgi:CRISPR-associated protein Cas1
MWPQDRVQIALQAIVLRENGYQCDEAVVFYQKTRQRVRIPVDDALIAEAEDAVARAWALAARGFIPAPLEDSPKCVGCSLNYHLPARRNQQPHRQSVSTAPPTRPVRSRKPAAQTAGQRGRPEPTPEIRRLMTPRDDLRPLYLNTQGLRVGKSGEVLQIKDKDKIVQEARIGEINQVNLLGNIQISTQAVQTLCEAAVPISYFSMGGYFYGITTGMNMKNVALRRSQFRLADSAAFPLSLRPHARSPARSATSARCSSATTSSRNRSAVARGMKSQAERAERAPDLETLLGIEGYAARVYFESSPA